MKIKTIATATSQNNLGYKKFIESLNKFKWDYDIISHNYVAYGSKMKNAYEYAKKTDATHLFILDAYDIVVLGTLEEAIYKMDNTSGVVFNAEKACWPHGDLAEYYPHVFSPWKYLNGGAAFVEVRSFIRLFEENPIKDTDNDQENLTKIFLEKREKYNMTLDNYCDVFQSIAFEHEDDFEYLNNRLINMKTFTCPIIIHGNGKTNMSKIYELI